MLRQESDMWARSMELDAQQRRREARERAQTRLREKLRQPNTRPVGQWKVAQAAAGGAVTLYDFETMLGGAPGPSTILLYETDLAAMSQLIHQVRLGGRIG